MGISLRGPWDQATINNYLRECPFPVRIACIGSDGFPRVISLWYRSDGDDLLCVSHRSSSLVRMLEKRPEVGFEVAPNEPPYHGVRGQGIASMEPLGEQAILRELLERYLGGHKSSLGDWLLSRSDDEVLIRVRPQRLYSWDYRERMQDAIA